jgi:parvulin-like peptidyl-prolyl isomerase
MRLIRTAATAVLVSAAVVGSTAERTVLEAILVRVNDRIVTVSDFRDRMRQELSQQPEALGPEELEAFADQVFGLVVDELILLERAKERRITVEDSDVDRAVAALREDNDLLDDDAWEAALESAGMTVDALRSRYRQGILVQRTVQSEIQPTEITEEELRQLYEVEMDSFKVPAKVELEQVFFPVAEDGGDREAVRRRAQGLVDRVREGSDLVAEATLAGVEVQELGAIPVSDLREEVVEELDRLEPGGLTEPITLAGGFQVLRLVERLPAGHQPFEEVKELLRRRESQRSYGDQTQTLVERLREEYLVEVHRELLPSVLEGLGNG